MSLEQTQAAAEATGIVLPRTPAEAAGWFHNKGGYHVGAPPKGGKGKTAAVQPLMLPVHHVQHPSRGRTGAPDGRAAGRAAAGGAG